MKDHVKIPGRTSVFTGLALAADPQTTAAVHTGRDTHADCLVYINRSTPLAFGAGMPDDRPLALTGRTRHGNPEKTLGTIHLPDSAAMLASLGAVPGLGTGSGTTVAFLPLGDLDFLFRALGRLPETYAHVVAQIHAGAGARAASPGAETEEITEYIAKSPEYILGGTEILKAVPAYTFMTELVIPGSLFRITQDLVGLGRFLESGFGFRIIRIAIRMIFHGQLAVGLFQLLS
jgi:hypothetical protein